jgi:dienelactone hydrolase
MKKLLFILLFPFVISFAFAEISKVEEPEIIQFNNGSLKLGGEIYKPKGSGPFPAVLYNHGSAPAMLNSQASKVIGPKFAAKGWIFFMPYRRGQGLSQDAGPYIGDEIKVVRKNGGFKLASQKLVELMSAGHLDDQLAAFEWLKAQKFVDTKRIATDGNSFGGIQVVLGAEKINYCAAVDASGGAESWSISPELQNLMKDSVRKSKSPILFFQAENDFDLSPTQVLSAEMKSSGKKFEVKIYPAFGKTDKEGHSFAYAGSDVWFDDVFSFIERNCTK